ncbi:nitroreductase family protein [Rugamonas sp. CCM 8940]|uniref:nitroreductase family protein n=1 Tax=Rugamonas sp. CCM 8940 TaxID=2765359 RepID=UPI003612FD8E
MPPLDDTLRHILELARWAPSGDNSQPWRFEIIDARRLVVHGHDTRAYCVYDLDGHPSQMSLGALLETMALAAGTYQLSMSVRRRHDSPTAAHLRRRLHARARRRPIRWPSSSYNAACSAARCAPSADADREDHAGADAAARHAGRLVARAPGRGWRWPRCVRRLAACGGLPTHRAVIEWNVDTSEDRIPDGRWGSIR